MDQNGKLIIFIVVLSIVIAVVLFVAIFIPARKIFIRKKHNKHVYNKVYRIALNNDYFLINNFTFEITDHHRAVVDHLLFADKYIFVIQDKYFSGDIMGSFNDPSLVLVDKKGEKSYVDNPFPPFSKLLSRLSNKTGIGTELMIGVTVVNDDCRVNINSESKQFFLVQRRKLKLLIKTVESRDINPLNQKKLQEAVLAVDRMNKK